MKELALFDIDGTIVKGQSQKIFLKYLLAERKIGVLFYFRLMIWFFLYKIGLIDDPKKAMEYAFSFLQGMSVESVSSMISDFFEKRLNKNIYQDALDVIHEQQNSGREVVLISNAVEPIVKEIARYIGVNRYACTVLEVADGKYTGRVVDIMYGDRKSKYIENFVKSNNFDLKTSWAYSDHVSDLSLLGMVGHPVTVNPTSALRRVARIEHWPVLMFK